MNALKLFFFILIWMLPAILVIIRRRQLKKRRIVAYDPGMAVGLGFRIIRAHQEAGQLIIDEVEPLEAAGLNGPTLSMVQDFSRNKIEQAGAYWNTLLKKHEVIPTCVYGCMDCRGGELPCFCPCEHRASIGGQT